jgi:hypothetical protein
VFFRQIPCSIASVPGIMFLGMRRATSMPMKLDKHGHQSRVRVPSAWQVFAGAGEKQFEQSRFIPEELWKGN